MLKRNFPTFRTTQLPFQYSNLTTAITGCCSSSFSSSSTFSSSLISRGAPISNIFNYNNTNNIISSPSLVTSQRFRSFKMFYDTDDPQITLQVAREIKDKEEYEGKAYSAKYLHALVAVAVAHYQRKDFDHARKCALYAHDTIVEKKGPRSTLVYFSATTCSKCSRALAKQLSTIIQERKEIGNETSIDEDVDTSSLMMARDKRGKQFSSIHEYLVFLYQEADRFEKISRRIIDAPDKYFMKTDDQHRQQGAEETPSSSADYETYNSNNSKTQNSSNENTNDEQDETNNNNNKDKEEEAQTRYDRQQQREQLFSHRMNARRKRDYEAEVRRGKVKEAEEAYKENVNTMASYQRIGKLKVERREKGKPIKRLFGVQR